MQSALLISHAHKAVAFMPTCRHAGATSQAGIVVQVPHERRDNVANPVEYGATVSLRCRPGVAS